MHSDCPIPTYRHVQPHVQVLAHRGFWRQPCERNTLAALTDALAQNYGVETDVRDLGGTLVISHDPPTSTSIPLEALFSKYSEMQATACLALNIKSCGLAERLHRLLMQYQIQRYFVFDMAIPDILSYLRTGLRVYARQSEIETSVAFYEECEGIWLDAFHSEWYSSDTIIQHVDHGKRVAVVSPELHGRKPEGVWQTIQALPDQYARNVLVCTDLPDAFSGGLLSDGSY